MSTTYVGREIMSRLGERFSDFSYKRAAYNPTNPTNRADKLEMEKIRWFSENPGRKEWHGLILKDQASYYARFYPIRAEGECLRCHGDPQDAPQQMKDIYGTQGGYGYQVGEVVAADAVYIPVDVTFYRVKETAWNVFLIATVILFTLLGLFYLLFNRTVVLEMNGLLTRFKGITDPRSGDKPLVPLLEANDEFDQLKLAFENVAADLKQTHDELRDSERRYRKLFESNRDAIIICSRDNRLIDINPAGCHLFSFKDKAEALSIETCYQLFWDGIEAKAFIETIRRDGYVEKLELPMVDRNGNKLIVMISASARSDDAGCFDGIDAWLHDVTGKREMEQQMAKAEKLAAVGQLASGVAHEINNPLGVIQVYANLIAKSGELGVQATDDLRVIQKHADQCQSVVQALLNFARASEPRKKRCDIHGIIDEVLAILEPQMKKQAIAFSLEAEGTLPWLVIDETQMKQVFMNLIINAVQAMPDGGAVCIAIGMDRRHNRVNVSVTDTGVGVAEMHLLRIFDPFFTTKAADKGTGLGLSVSYGLVQQHGGDITVKSASGKGSTFTVSLPFTAESEES
jgi:PAS domain S-box-containing protein